VDTVCYGGETRIKETILMRLWVYHKWGYSPVCHTAQDPSQDDKKKEFIFEITELCLFGTPDNKTHNDAENPPDNKIGTEEKDEKSCTNDGTGNNKATQDN